jgi:hypothetical protein
MKTARFLSLFGALVLGLVLCTTSAAQSILTEL